MDVTIQIKIGEVTTACVAGAPGCPPLIFEPPQDRFQVENGIPDVLLRVHVGELPSFDTGVRLFHCDRWSLYQREGGFLLRFIVSDLTYPHRLALFNSSFEEGDLFVARDVAIPDVGDGAGRRELDPLKYPLGELMIINYLARGKKGVDLHALGIEDGGRGLVFSGVSGAGKSTMANLWKGTGVTLLSDDRIIVRRNDRGYVMHGTPWQGDAHIASPKSAPLEKLFFIERAARNYVKELSPVDAATRLMVRCFPPFYDKDGMEFTLDFLGKIAEEIACYELGFMPDASAIDFVRGHQ